MGKVYYGKTDFMTMHIHIATAGQAVEPVIKGFNAIPGIDRVYLVYSSAFEESALALRSFFESAMVGVELRQVSGFDFQAIVDTIYSIYEAEHARGAEFSINITGGTNLMAAAACSCAFFVGARICYVLRDPSRSAAEQLVWIPTPRTPDLHRIKDKTLDILGFILEETRRGATVTTADINARFNVDKQNSSYHLRILEDEGLIERSQGVEVDGRVNNRMKSIALTGQGRLVASWLTERSDGVRYHHALRGQHEGVPPPVHVPVRIGVLGLLHQAVLHEDPDVIPGLLLVDPEPPGYVRVGHRRAAVAALQDVREYPLGEVLVPADVHRLRGGDLDDLAVYRAVRVQRVEDLGADVVGAVARGGGHQVGPAGDVHRVLHVPALGVLVDPVDHGNDAHEVGEGDGPELDLRHHVRQYRPDVQGGRRGLVGVGVQQVQGVDPRKHADDL